jgi:hypothetical protein
MWAMTGDLLEFYLILIVWDKSIKRRGKTANRGDVALVH